jgi:cell division protein FtsZ
MIEFENNADNKKILVIGIGGAAHSIIEKINTYGLKDIKTFFIDSDSDAVSNSTATEKICVPSRLVKGLGSDTISVTGNPELAGIVKSFVESLPKAEIVFTVAGLGGSAGTVITPLLLQILKEKLYWVWSLNTVPFFFEGKSKIINSLKQIRSIQNYANSVLIIPHDKIFKMGDKDLSMKEAFIPAGNICVDLITNVCALTCDDGEGQKISIKFSDIKDRFSNKKSSGFGIGGGSGDSRVNIAMEKAILSPLLGKETLLSAEKIIVNISGNDDLRLEEINKGIEILHTYIPKDKNVVFGVTIDNKLQDTLKAAIILLGTDTGSPADDWAMSLPSETGIRNGIRSQNSDGNKGSKINKQGSKAQQTMIDFKKISKTQKGCFETSDATMFGGEDLDIPTFLRKKR